MHRRGQEVRGVKGKGPCTRDRKQRTQCIFIRIWQVNTRWQQCCHAGRGHSEALMCNVAGRLQGLVVRLFISSMAHVLNNTEYALLRCKNISLPFLYRQTSG